MAATQVSAVGAVVAESTLASSEQARSVAAVPCSSPHSEEALCVPSPSVCLVVSHLAAWTSAPFSELVPPCLRSVALAQSSPQGDAALVV